jgi:hypothetical protein
MVIKYNGATSSATDSHGTNQTQQNKGFQKASFPSIIGATLNLALLQMSVFVGFLPVSRTVSKAYVVLFLADFCPFHAIGTT